MSIADISFFSALLAGALSFLSPCVLPLVPPYLCFITGASLEELVDHTVGRVLDRVTRLAQPLDHEARDFGVVFDEKETHRHALSRCPCPAARHAVHWRRAHDAICPTAAME